jgi:hypothetical protein
MFSLGLVLETRGKSGEAETWWRRAAEAGDSQAMVNLGVLLKKRSESGEAETWYRRAVEAGDSGTMFNLRVLLDEGRGESGETETWFRRAAEAGDSRAMSNLGVLLEKRLGGHKGGVWSNGGDWSNRYCRRRCRQVRVDAAPGPAPGGPREPPLVAAAGFSASRTETTCSPRFWQSSRRPCRWASSATSP